MVSNGSSEPSASNRVNPVLATKLKSGIDDDSQSVWEVTHIGPQEVWPLKGKFTVARKDSRVAIPGVIRSRIELEKQGISFLGPGSVAPSELPITPRGTTYNMAQEVTWLDNQHFAVGRWDGSLSIFSYIESATQGPLITTAVSDPGSEGVQMIALIAPWTFVTSCGGTRLSVWTATNNDWRTLQTQNIAYPQQLGAANSAAVTSDKGTPMLAVGHESGLLSTWVIGGPKILHIVGVINLQNPHPVNPWNLHNIRGVAVIGGTLVVTGSEDGFISVVQLPSTTVSQTVYNPAAQRGINDISLSNGTDLLVANCSVGESDFNLWAFQVAPNGNVTPTDRVNLRVDPTAPQVFNFCTVWSDIPAGRCFFSSTEEGALWAGTLTGGKFDILGYQEVTSSLGSALAYDAEGKLALVSYDLYQFDTGGKDAKTT